MTALYNRSEVTNWFYLQRTPQEATICRFVIKNPTQLPTENIVCNVIGNQNLPIEFPQINYKYSEKEYQYTYMAFNYWYGDSMIVKVCWNSCSVPILNFTCVNYLLFHFLLDTRRWLVLVWKVVKMGDA